MNSVRDRVISLLGQGFSNSQVAAACGVTASWISQLLDEPEVREEVATLRAGLLQEKVETDRTLEDLEKRALKVLGDKMSFIRGPKEAAAIYATLNKATRKTANSNPEQDAVAIQQVNIILPRAAASIHVRLNADNQVIEVEGRSMATLPSRALPSLVAERKQATVIPALPASPQVRAQQAAITSRLQQEDSNRAIARLDLLAPVEILLDGVPCVL